MLDVDEQIPTGKENIDLPLLICDDEDPHNGEPAAKRRRKEKVFITHHKITADNAFVQAIERFIFFAKITHANLPNTFIFLEANSFLFYLFKIFDSITSRN